MGSNSKNRFTLHLHISVPRIMFYFNNIKQNTNNLFHVFSKNIHIQVIFDQNKKYVGSHDYKVQHWYLLLFDPIIYNGKYLIPAMMLDSRPYVPMSLIHPYFRQFYSFLFDLSRDYLVGTGSEIIRCMSLLEANCLSSYIWLQGTTLVFVASPLSMQH
jgi:hypothetical protein